MLLDVNNVYVSACNHDFDAAAFIRAINPQHVGEIHLAGHAVNQVDGQELRIDDHGSAVCEPVWSLFELTLQTIGQRPALVEWDSNIPSLDVLTGEAHRAQRYLDEHHALVA